MAQDLNNFAQIWRKDNQKVIKQASAEPKQKQCPRVVRVPRVWALWMPQAKSATEDGLQFLDADWWLRDRCLRGVCVSGCKNFA